MRLKHTKYAHNLFTINISYRKNKNCYTLDRQSEIIENHKLTRRTYKVSRYTWHYSLYHNVDFELVKAIYKNTSIYYSIFIK